MTDRKKRQHLEKMMLVKLDGACGRIQIDH